MYDHGFSAVCIGNPFNYEFIDDALTAAVPGYTPSDVQDLLVALTRIDERLDRSYPGRLGPRALMGYSMGGFEALFTAAMLSEHPAPVIHFDRYLAISTPVRLLYGVDKLDEFYQAPLAWPAAERNKDIENTFLKVAALTKNSLVPQTSLPFSGIESKFLTPKPSNDGRASTQHVERTRLNDIAVPADNPGTLWKPPTGP